MKIFLKSSYGLSLASEFETLVMYPECECPVGEQGHLPAGTSCPLAWLPCSKAFLQKTSTLVTGLSVVHGQAAHLLGTNFGGPDGIQVLAGRQLVACWRCVGNGAWIPTSAAA